MYTIRVQAQKTSFFCFQETERLVAETKMILNKLGSMALLLVKMAIQNADFLLYSPSILVVSALYSATAFLKHSRNFQGDRTSYLVGEVRKIIFLILQEELGQ